MTGLVVYTLVSLGLGALLPALMLANRRSIGAMLFGGYGAMLALLFMLQAVLGVNLRFSFWVIAIIALGGLCRLGWLFRASARDLAVHPAIVLPVVAGIAIAVRGDIGYLPYAVDEFTNWIGAAKNIHLHGSYAAIREDIYLPAYTPGWRLALLLPWQIDGIMVPGRSAAAAFVLHAGLVALLFDIIRREAEDHLDIGPRWIAAVAWLVVLVYLVAQGTGALWTYVLLVEQPQIYFYAGIAFLLFAVRSDPSAAANVWLHIGLAVLGGYLIKAATLAAVPGILLAALWIFWRAGKLGTGVSRSQAVQSLALLLGPVLCAAALWRMVLPEAAQGCLASPMATLTPAALDAALNRDWADLGTRYASAVGGYVFGYKTPVLVVALAGLVFACLRRRAAAVIALGVFAAVYLVLLYWYHLSCFGDFYFVQLNSIERFTRVVLQPLHALGLLAAASAALYLAGRKGGAAITGSRPGRGAIVIAMAGVIGILTYQLDRTLKDVSTRHVQPIDHRIAEVRTAAAFIETQLADRTSPPVIQFVSQGTDSDLLGYAAYFATGGTAGAPRTLFRAAGDVSWSRGIPANHWQQRSSDQDLVRKFSGVDVIWPIIVDPWIEGILRGLLSGDQACDGAVTKFVWVKQDHGGFACRPKPPLR